jgi:hypothetical protein
MRLHWRSSSTSPRCCLTLMQVVGQSSSSYDIRDTSAPIAIRECYKRIAIGLRFTFNALYVHMPGSVLGGCPQKKRKRAEVFADNHQ